MAVAVLTCDRVLADLDGRAPRRLEEQSRVALAKAPHAAAWADQFTTGVRPSHKGFRRRAAPTIVQDTVEGIAQACMPDPDGMLRDLLVQATDVCDLDRPRPGPRWDVGYSLWVSAGQRQDR